MTNYKKLEAWKVSMALAKEIYRLTRAFPKEEIFGLSSQVKRAAVSIPANIAEGMGRRHKKDSAHFLTIARGSAYEVETLMEIAETSGMLPEKSARAIEDQLSETLRILNGLIRYFDGDSLN